MSTHTPAPWQWTDGEEPIDINTYVSPGYYKNPLLVGADNNSVIGCDEYWVIGPCLDDETMQANARLIAAAPELLEALLPLVARFTRFMASDRNHADAYNAMVKGAFGDWESAVAALTKATGANQ